MVAEPVAGLFLPVPALACLMSKDCPPDWLAVMPPMLIDSRELPWTPSPTCVLTAVSETQELTSLCVALIDIDSENLTSPIPAPYTVRLADPVDARLARRWFERIMFSAEANSDKLPIDCFIVAVNRLLKRNPCE